MCELKRLNNIWKQIYPELALNTEVGFSHILRASPPLYSQQSDNVQQPSVEDVIRAAVGPTSWCLVDFESPASGVVAWCWSFVW